MATPVIVSLTDVKTHLRYPNPSQAHPDDAAITKFIAAADQVVAFECDDMLPAAYTERHDGGARQIYLRNLPVLSVQNVEESWGWINYQLDQQAPDSPSPTSMFAYSVDNFEIGEISRRTVANVNMPFHPGDNNIYVQYTAGYSPIPGNIILAELELIAHWWQASQLRSGSTGAGAPGAASYDAVEGANYSRDTESGNQNINIGVPYRILELLKPHRHAPYIG